MKKALIYLTFSVFILGMIISYDIIKYDGQVLVKNLIKPKNEPVLEQAYEYVPVEKNEVTTDGGRDFFGDSELKVMEAEFEDGEDIDDSYDEQVLDDFSEEDSNRGYEYYFDLLNSEEKKIYSVIKQMINSIVVVTIPRISLYVLKKKDEEIKNIVGETFEAVSILIVPASVGLAILSRHILMVLSGGKYSDAEMPLIILSIALIFSTLGNVNVNAILIPHRKENSTFILLAASALINIILNILLIPRFNYTVAAVTTLISEVIVCSFGAIMARRIIKVSIIRQLLISAVGGVIVTGCCLLFKYLFANNLLIIICSVFTSVTAYLIFLLIIKNNIVHRLFVSKVVKKFSRSTK